MATRHGTALFLAGWATAVVTMFTGAVVRHLVEVTMDIRRRARAAAEANSGSDTDTPVDQPPQP